MPNITDWIAELTEERQREELAAKEAARVHHERIEAIDASIAELQRTAALLEGAPRERSVAKARRIELEDSQVDLGRALGPEPGTQYTYWKWAEMAYREAGHPMRMPALSEAIKKMGGPEIFRESLRTILRGKPEIFEYKQAGYFALQEWPEETKDKKLEGA